MGEFITPDVLPEDTFCRVLLIPNDPKWIGAVSGALLPMIYPSEWISFGGLSPEVTAERCLVMLNEFWASSGCGDVMACCDDIVRINRFNPDTGRPEVSTDNGATWKPSPEDPQNQVKVYPPLVTGGSGGKTKCDAATNASEHINELITATAENLTTAGDVFALAVGVAEAILALVLIIGSAGVLTAPVTAVATAIWAASTSAFSLGVDLFNAYWTVDKKDFILCKLFCNIGENGQFSDAQYQAFLADVYEGLDASPALSIVMNSINALGSRGLSQMASYGAAAESDCDDCACGDEWCKRWLGVFGGDDWTLETNGGGVTTYSGGKFMGGATPDNGATLVGVNISPVNGNVKHMEIDYEWIRTEPAGGVNRLTVEINSVGTFFGIDLTGSGSSTLAFDLDVTDANIRIIGGVFGSGAVINLTRIKMNGDGDNPFGSDNC